MKESKQSMLFFWDPGMRCWW